MRHPALAAEVRFYPAVLVDESGKSVPQGLKARDFSIILAAQSKTIFLALPQRIGCPILRVFCEGWDATAPRPRPFPATSAYPTLRRKREGWGTRSFVAGQEILASTIPICPWFSSPWVSRRLMGTRLNPRPSSEIFSAACETGTNPRPEIAWRAIVVVFIC
jgi:hypothetical protein